MKSRKQDDLFEMVKYSLWGNGNPTVSSSLLEEMKHHAISALPGSVLGVFHVPPELMIEWKKEIIQTVSKNIKYEYIQSQLPIQMPYVILKGTTAAQYYPHPEYRVMGDIDMMTSRENYESACRMILDDGWQEVTSYSENKRGRHRTFEKDGFSVEIHAFFASMNDPIKAKYFDDYIIRNITNNHILPDLINGLVLLEHINQHLEEGLGLRQIIDWMLFVAKCLPDDKWRYFEKMTEKTGLTKLAITTTRMCEIYLGLEPRKWCAKANDNLCRDLMDYVKKCGNFGSKLDHSEISAISRTFRLKHPFLMLKELQKRGIINWKDSTPHFLRPFAWICEGCKVLRGTPNFNKGYKEARKLDTMFKALGVKRSDEGLVYYENGEYIVKKQGNFKI